METKGPKITFEQVKAVQRQIATTTAIAPAVTLYLSLAYKNRSSKYAQITGTIDQFMFTSQFNAAQGRFMIAAEAEAGRPVCIIGAEVARKLFVNEPALGKRIRIEKQAFEVTGELERRGGFMKQNRTDAVIMAANLERQAHCSIRFWTLSVAGSALASNQYRPALALSGQRHAVVARIARGHGSF